MSMDTIAKALGLGALHIAVFRGDLKGVKELLREGIDVNTRSHTLKMTGLHFAIILKDYNIACFLIRKGGDLQAADEKGRTPVKYNRKKLGGKYLALFKTLGFQHEESVGVQSRKLSSLFRYPVAMRSLLGRKRHSLSRTVMYLNGKTVVVAKQVGEVLLPELAHQSTHGFIAGPADDFPRVLATSGWKNSTSTPNVLPNGIFTQLVRDAAGYLGFRLPPQPFDSPQRSGVAPEDTGRYFACHVEKQLGVYWVLTLLLRHRETTDVARIEELKGVALQDNEEHARIFIDHSPCDNCLGFLSSLERATGVKFIVEPVPFAVKGERQPKGCPNCFCDSCTKKPPLPQARVIPPAEVLEEEDDHDEVTKEELASLRQFIPHTPIKVANRGRVTTTSPPTPWAKFAPNVAKPVPKKVTQDEYNAAASLRDEDNSSQLWESQASGVVPASTINGNRSAFFASPSVGPPVATSLPLGSPTQAERTPSEIIEDAPSTSPPRAEDTLSEIEEISSRPVVEIFEPSIGWHAPSIAEDPVDTNPRPRITIEESRKKLNLSRFSLTGGTSTSSPASTPRRKRGRPKGSKNKKPTRVTVRKEGMVREKSTFAQAFRFHQKRNQRSHGNRRTPAQIGTPTKTSTTRAIRITEKVCRDAQKYFDQHMKDGTLPNDIEPQICRHGLDMPHYL